jgi:hypothetical protein
VARGDPDVNHFEATRAFPYPIAILHGGLIDSLAATALWKAWESPEPVAFGDEVLMMPQRLDYSPAAVDAAMSSSGDSAVVAACLGTKSYDGYLRQRSIEALLANPRAWSIPYLVDALGDYVLEILQVMEGYVPGELEKDYAEYLVANEERFVRLCRRCVSYWNEFDRFRCRNLYPDWNAYPGARLIADLVAAARTLQPTFGRDLKGVFPNRNATPPAPRQRSVAEVMPRD